MRALKKHNRHVAPFGLHDFCVRFDVAGVLLGVAVVVDADEQQVVGVLRHLGGVLPALDLVDGGIGILPELQFNDNGGRLHVLARDEHDVGKAFAAGQLAMHHVVVAGVVVDFF